MLLRLSAEPALELPAQVNLVRTFYAPLLEEKDCRKQGRCHEVLMGKGPATHPSDGIAIILSRMSYTCLIVGSITEL